MFLLLVSMVTIWFLPIMSRGILLDPPSRLTMWKRGFVAPLNYINDEPLCGGNQHQELHFSGNNFDRGFISRNYLPGENVIFEVDERQLNQGYLEFKICPSFTLKDPETQECFNNHPVSLADGSQRYYIRKDVDVGKVNVKIPQDIECNFCVLQYHYHQDSLGKKRSALNNLDDFYGCSDIRILGRNHGGHQSLAGIQGLIARGPEISNTFHTKTATFGSSSSWTQTSTNVNSVNNGGIASPVQSGGSVRGPSINGLVVKGPANFGNIHGPGSVHNGDSNAWTQTNNNLNNGGGFNQGPVLGNNVNNPNGGRIRGPSLQGAIIHGPANFGNIHGPGSDHSGNSNAWTQTNTNVNSVGGYSNPGLVDIIRPQPVHRGNSNAWTHPNNNINNLNGNGLGPVLTNGRVGVDLANGGGFYPSGNRGLIHNAVPANSGHGITGIVIKGPANFGNIHGDRSVHHGNSAAWGPDGSNGNRLNNLARILKRYISGQAVSKIVSSI